MFPSVQKSKTIVSSSRMLLKSLAILERYLSSSLLLMAVMSLCLRTDYKTTFMKIFKWIQTNAVWQLPRAVNCWQTDDLSRGDVIGRRRSVRLIDLRPPGDASQLHTDERRMITIVRFLWSNVELIAHNQRTKLSLIFSYIRSITNSHNMHHSEMLSNAIAWVQTTNVHGNADKSKQCSTEYNHLLVKLLQDISEMTKTTQSLTMLLFPSRMSNIPQQMTDVYFLAMLS